MLLLRFVRPSQLTSWPVGTVMKWDGEWGRLSECGREAGGRVKLLLEWSDTRGVVSIVRVWVGYIDLLDPIIKQYSSWTLPSPVAPRSLRVERG
jgi:hypothetical protein